MQIRPATPQDKPAMIALLKKSLGEGLIPKSEALWTWKHEQNPFGASFVLLAEENNTIIGLRAFMQWQWKWKGNLYKAIRAVDTATHPDHQGKGIFKKLTLQQLELCKQQGIHFVFNTPNDQSRPGYLKMGWVQQGRMPLKFKVTNPIALAWAVAFKKGKAGSTAEDPTPVQQWDPAVFKLMDRYTNTDNDQLQTVLSTEYIRWRYADNPLFRYNYFTDFENFLLIGRIKSHSFTRELRLVDCMLFNNASSDRHINSRISRTILPYCKKNKIQVISFSGQQYQLNRSALSWMGIIPVQNRGPIVTVRDLNMSEQFSSLLNINNWGYSLGDMELF
ncbi:GNAT family N-acetyltransferase [Longitalea luteola]|uniref:GNAT family N-acetyltransferase n=1 Tax=Longitalea luteola TaxID=2812563 RepID=UPI001A972819|nr:GNAT family N-acetyltransferase [Longitalea luteola]